MTHRARLLAIAALVGGGFVAFADFALADRLFIEPRWLLGAHQDGWIALAGGFAAAAGSAFLLLREY